VDGAQTSHLAIRLCDRKGDRIRVDIQTQKSYLLLHDRLPSARGSLLSFWTHGLTHDQRIGAGHSILQQAPRRSRSFASDTYLQNSYLSLA
jgi:hypothetical protein